MSSVQKAFGAPFFFSSLLRPAAAAAAVVKKWVENAKLQLVVTMVSLTQWPIRVE